MEFCGAPGVALGEGGVSLAVARGPGRDVAEEGAVLFPLRYLHINLDYSSRLYY